IEVDANAATDARTREAIRMHLQAVAADFAAGRFDAPFATHGVVPSGVETMQRLRADVTYTFEATPRGGRVRIRSASGEALGAVHRFLRFQIREHKTGDSLDAPVDERVRLR